MEVDGGDLGGNYGSSADGWMIPHEGIGEKGAEAGAGLIDKGTGKGSQAVEAVDGGKIGTPATFAAARKALRA